MVAPKDFGDLSRLLVIKHIKLNKIRGFKLVLEDLIWVREVQHKVAKELNVRVDKTVSWMPTTQNRGKFQ